MKVAITGSTGFLGSHILESLADLDPVGVARRPRDARTRKADLSDPDSLRRAFEGMDVVVANAALSPGRSEVTEAALLEANLTGTRNTLDAAVAAGVRRVVLVSTVAVYQPRWGITFTEDSPLRDPEDRRWDFSALTTNPAYARSKAAGEALAWTYEDRLELVAVRPGPIWGPRDHKLTLRYARWARSRLPLAPGLKLPHATGPDVAAAIARCVTEPVAGHRFNIGGHHISPAQILALWTGRRRLAIPLPSPVRIDDRKAQQMLGWRPSPLDEAVHSAAEWARQHSG